MKIELTTDELRWLVWFMSQYMDYSRVVHVSHPEHRKLRDKLRKLRDESIDPEPQAPEPKE